jgi:hypothetical protein
MNSVQNSWNIKKWRERCGQLLVEFAVMERTNTGGRLWYRRYQPELIWCQFILESRTLWASDRVNWLKKQRLQMAGNKSRWSQQFPGFSVLRESEDKLTILAYFGFTDFCYSPLEEYGVYGCDTPIPALLLSPLFVWVLTTSAPHICCLRGDFTVKINNG